MLDEKALASRRLGGVHGGQARAEKLSAEQRSAIAKKAVAVRWEKQRKKETLEEKLQEVLKEIHTLNAKIAEINTLLRKSPPGALLEIDDKGIRGYYLSDILSFLGERKSLFDAWYQGKTGGIFEGKYYVKKEDFLTFLQENP